jgi:hypothetical protein
MNEESFPPETVYTTCASASILFLSNKSIKLALYSFLP